jgi:hypothetical protein
MYHGVSVLELNLYNFVSLDLFHLFTVYVQLKLSPVRTILWLRLVIWLGQSI